MHNSAMKYAAMRAKVMAMRGKMLTESDFAKLRESRNFQDMVSFLKTNSSWSETISKIPAPVTPEKLSDAVSDKVWEDSEKLYHFSAMDDKAYLRFSMCRAEYEMILTALRRLGSTTAVKPYEVPEFVRGKCAVNVTALESCSGWDELVSACEGSIYEKALKKLEVDPQTRLPNYSQTAVLLENTYYRELFSFISHKYLDTGKGSLKELIGRQADMLNIVSLMRLLKYFPNSLEKADKMLIPVSYRLSPELTGALSHARSESEAVDILRQTKYGEKFADRGEDRLENVYEDAMSDFCDRIIHTAEPSESTAQSYLVLKEMECRKLKRMIEETKYGTGSERTV